MQRSMPSRTDSSRLFIIFLMFTRFLNTGGCGPNGGSCTAVDLELGTQDGGTSSVVIDLIPT